MSVRRASTDGEADEPYESDLKDSATAIRLDGHLGGELSAVDRPAQRDGTGIAVVDRRTLKTQSYAERR